MCVSLRRKSVLGICCVGLRRFLVVLRPAPFTRALNTLLILGTVHVTRGRGSRFRCVFCVLCRCTLVFALDTSRLASIRHHTGTFSHLCGHVIFICISSLYAGEARHIGTLHISDPHGTRYHSPLPLHCSLRAHTPPPLCFDFIALLLSVWFPLRSFRVRMFLAPHYYRAVCSHFAHVSPRFATLILTSGAAPAHGGHFSQARLCHLYILTFRERDGYSHFFSHACMHCYFSVHFAFVDSFAHRYVRAIFISFCHFISFPHFLLPRCAFLSEHFVSFIPMIGVSLRDLSE